ncbi:hypothetical protein SNEBB_009941 [Seison nebaliae]|nr:hypothetical protein SNEBB_009941 [Seison nebaliae]
MKRSNRSIVYRLDTKERKLNDHDENDDDNDDEMKETGENNFLSIFTCPHGEKRKEIISNRINLSIRTDKECQKKKCKRLLDLIFYQKHFNDFRCSSMLKEKLKEVFIQTRKHPRSSINLPEPYRKNRFIQQIQTVDFDHIILCGVGRASIERQMEIVNYLNQIYGPENLLMNIETSSIRKAIPTKSIIEQTIYEEDDIEKIFQQIQQNSNSTNLQNDNSIPITLSTIKIYFS